MTKLSDELEIDEAAVLSCGQIDKVDLERFFAPLGVEIAWVADRKEIPYSYWGEREAGIYGKRLYLRLDTPVHSALHEGCHILCAAAEGRDSLETDALGEQTEEDAVCYLQILAADRIRGFGRKRALEDMDAWGYTFRLGSASAWFEHDAEDARQWLEERGLLNLVTAKTAVEPFDPTS